MGVKGDNSSLRGPGAGPMAEGEAEPHKRSRWLSGQNAPRLRKSQGEHRKGEAIKNEYQRENRRFSSGDKIPAKYLKNIPQRL